MNLGALALKAKLNSAGRGARTQLAEKCGVGLDRVSHWLAGPHKPSTKCRAIIEDLYQVSWRLWDEELPKPQQKGAA